MRRLVACALAVLAAIALGACRTVAPASAGDGAGWSDVSNGLRARLFTRLSHISNGTGIVVTQLELGNVRAVMNPMLVTLRDTDITYRVTDADGREVPAKGGYAFDSPVIDRLDLVLPHDGSIRFRVGPNGFGIPGDQAALVDLGPRFGRVLPRDGKTYYLDAVLDIPEVQRVRGDGGGLWHGRLEIPRVRIVTEPEPVDPVTLGPRIDRLGAEMLGENWDVSEEAVRQMSLIDDPRVIPWYVKAMRTDSYDLKSHALDRLARLEGDAALEGLKIGMATQGDDIGNCAKAEVAASCAANIRHAAAGALARSPHPQAKSLLFSMEEDPAMAVRLTVLQTAARMNTPESLALLERRTQDGDATVRGEASRLLELRETGVEK
jgi:hypothetical protein